MSVGKREILDRMERDALADAAKGIAGRWNAMKYAPVNEAVLVAFLGDFGMMVSIGFYDPSEGAHHGWHVGQMIVDDEDVYAWMPLPHVPTDGELHDLDFA